MTTEIKSILDLLKEQQEKRTLVGLLYEKGLYKQGELFRVTLFKGANYFPDGCVYRWTEESNKVEDAFSPGAQFSGYHMPANEEFKHEIDRISLFMGWNPHFVADKKRNGLFIPVPDTEGYCKNRNGQNEGLSFYQDAIYSVEVLSGKAFLEPILNKKSR